MVKKPSQEPFNYPNCLILQGTVLGKRGAVLLVLVFLAAICTLSFLQVNAEPRTIVVPDDYATIQEAVDVASSGDTVLVKSGTYHQNVTINKQISLIGEDSETTILYGPKSSTVLDPSSTIQINADNVKISGFTIKDNMIAVNARGDMIQVVSNVMDVHPTGIELIGSFGTIANNTVTSSMSCYISISGSNNSIIENHVSGSIELTGSFNLVKGNSVGRINLETADSNSISNNNCVFLDLRGCSYNIVSRNVIRGDGNWGIYMGVGHDNVFYANNVSDFRSGHNGFGVALGGSRHGLSENNTFYHNNFINNSRGVGWNWDLNGTKNSWDNGKEGNYWDDERTSATHRAWNDFNVTDDNKDGINDTPYVINDDNVDRYPLAFPFDIKNNTVVLPPQEPFPIALAATVSVAIAAMVAIGLLVYFRKRNH